MTADIAITVGVGLASTVFLYASIHLEDEITRFLSYITALNMIIAALGVMAIGSGSMGILNIVFSAINIVTGFLVFFLGYFAIRTIIEMIEMINEKRK